MRIPYPESIPFRGAVYFALVLFIIQWLEGTALYFCIGTVLFIAVAALAFNAAGGLTRASGAYIFSYSMLVVIVGICYKAYLGEPAQSNLLDPRTDIELYVGSISAMYAAVVVSRRFSRKRGLLEDLLRESRMYRSSVGCIIIGVFGAFAIALLDDPAHVLQKAFGQLNQLIPLGILIGVMYEIRRSGGRRSLNPYILIGGAYFFFLGATGFSKEGMFTPFVCWLMPACASRIRLSTIQLFSICAVVFVSFHYLVPFSQYGKGLLTPTATLSDRIKIAMPLLEDPENTRKKYLKTQAEEDAGIDRGLYYNNPQGLWDRLQFLSLDDPLNKLSDSGKQVGFAPLILAFINVVPHVIWPNKPEPITGNYYAHELGQLSPDDTTTGISFSPTAEAFHIAGWQGVLVIAPLLWFMFFFVFDSLLGDIRSTPWGLLAFVSIAHVAPEGGLTGLIHLVTFGVEIIVFCALFATWLAPLVAILVLGARSQEVRERATLFTGGKHFSKNMTIKLFDRYYPQGRHEGGTRPFHRLCRSEIAPGAEILEIGSGPSNPSSEMLSSIGNLTGLDVDSDVLGNRWLKHAHVFEGGRMPFADESFDACCSDFVLEHVEHPDAHFKEVARVLRPGGVYCFRTMNLFHYVSMGSRLMPHSMHLLLANRLRGLNPAAHDPYPTYYRANSAGKLRRLCAASGLATPAISMLEPEPAYGRAHALLFYPMMAYERIVNSTSLFLGLRITMLVVARKPAFIRAS